MADDGEVGADLVDEVEEEIAKWPAALQAVSRFADRRFVVGTIVGAALVLSVAQIPGVVLTSDECQAAKLEQVRLTERVNNLTQRMEEIEELRIADAADLATVRASLIDMARSCRPADR